ncbi:MAG: hypothetical protein HY825_13455 [Acidobacteria bacterium]|nr:hypothetical protein [Acidobacteriota bacterium]
MATKPRYTPLLDSSGNKVPSVSTILRKFQDPSNLLTWAWKIGASGKSLQEARDAQDTAGHVAAARAMALLTDELFDVSAYSRDLITATDRPLEVFATWAGGVDLRLAGLEQPTVSDELGFGANVTTALIGSDLVVLSLKAGKGVYLEDVLTVAAHAHLTGIDRAQVIRFGKDSGGFDENRALHADKLAPAWALFRTLLDAYYRLGPVEAVLKGAA